MTTLSQIESEFSSYQQIIDLYDDHKDKMFETIDIYMYRWFSANMCSALGAVLELLVNELNNIDFQFSSNTIKKILQKNNFLSFYGYPSEYDSNFSTIRFLKLKPTDGKFFKDYVVKELVTRSEMPHMSIKAIEKITESIYEIFVNAQIHSQSSYIFTCGQYYPRRHVIEFTITDIGIGFKKKINNRFNVSLNSVQAILWAVKDKHTTKTGVPGGIGLAILKEFVQINRGKLQIISDDGFYQYHNLKETTDTFTKPFPGTIVNLQFNTNDDTSYITKEEVNQEIIF